jgi:hypothetical protein
MAMHWKVRHMWLLISSPLGVGLDREAVAVR